MAEQEAQNLFNPNHTNTNNSATPGKNVVLIIMESVGKEYVGFYNNKKGYTPFLDSLMRNKITGPKVYIMDVVSNQTPATNDHKIFSVGCVEKVLK